MAEFNIYPTVEGVFLAFETNAGQVAMVSVEAIAETLPQVARETVLKWCEEVQAEAEASGPRGWATSATRRLRASSAAPAGWRRSFSFNEGKQKYRRQRDWQIVAGTRMNK